MNQTQYASAPKLAPPGAGLPLPQRLALKFWYGPIVSKRTTPEKSREDYERLVERLIALAQKMSVEARGKKCLVDPIPGLEDSSRYWSMNEVLEHLMIVARNVEMVICSLAAGRVPDGTADTAAVKPKGNQGDVLAEYVAYAPLLLKRLDETLRAPGMDFSSPLTFKHPWFGDFTARQWYWLLSTHQGIHYAQAKAIAKRCTPEALGWSES